MAQIGVGIIGFGKVGTGTAKNLVEKFFIWDKAKPAVVIELDPKQIATAGGGPGKYRIKVYSGSPEPFIDKTVKIE